MTARAVIPPISDLLTRAQAGLARLQGSWPGQSNRRQLRPPRSILTRCSDRSGRWPRKAASRSPVDAINAILRGEKPAPAGAPAAAPKVGLTAADFQSAATRLKCAVAQIRAVWEVESGGGWYTDVHAEILALDGPCSFLDGDMPKILREPHQFDRLTLGMYRASHTNISSAKWNRSLNVGGEGEYRRLRQAMQLDRQAALKAASWGGAQIMAFNHFVAAFETVEAFVQAMQISEAEQLKALLQLRREERLGERAQADFRLARGLRPVRCRIQWLRIREARTRQSCPHRAGSSSERSPQSLQAAWHAHCV
jgi:hypothetical protein